MSCGSACGLICVGSVASGCTVAPGCTVVSGCTVACALTATLGNVVAAASLSGTVGTSVSGNVAD